MIPGKVLRNAVFQSCLELPRGSRSAAQDTADKAYSGLAINFDTIYC